jgi:hypothetical protein
VFLGEGFCRYSGVEAKVRIVVVAAKAEAKVGVVVNAGAKLSAAVSTPG